DSTGAITEVDDLCSPYHPIGYSCAHCKRKLRLASTTPRPTFEGQPPGVCSTLPSSLLPDIVAFEDTIPEQCTPATPLFPTHHLPAEAPHCPTRRLSTSTSSLRSLRNQHTSDE
ncbi:hypothetical protein PTI98_008316, partial [Pleurotus ostreatus]